MLDRACLPQIVEWSARAQGRKPLLIRGARQVGKTTLVRMLAEQLGFQLIELNMEKPYRFTSTLGDLNPRRTVEAIEFELNVRIDPGTSILFFDEVQACPQVLPLLRYFYEEAPEFRVVTTGSLLEFVLAEPDFSMPVGRVELLYVGPLTFEEFLHAIGEQMAVETLTNYRLGEQIPMPIHDKLNFLTRLYSIVGGMPEAVAEYARTRSFSACERVKAQIIETFRLDFGKYRHKANPRVLTLAFDAVPRLVGRKLIYSHIDADCRSDVLSRAVEQLRLARVVSKVFNCHANGVPLAAERNDRFFKILSLDVGLLLSQLRLSPTDVDRVAELNLVNAGTLAEQLVGQQLYAMQPPSREPELHYWAREEKAASAEVDFVVADLRHGVVPIEVKAGATGRLRSLHVMVQEKGIPVAVRFCANVPTILHERRGTTKGNVDFHLVSLPHYLVQQLLRLLEDVA